MERQQNYRRLDAWRKLLQRFDWESSGRLLVYSVVVGFLAGLAAALVYVAYQSFDGSVQNLYLTAGIDLPKPEEYTSQSGVLPGASFVEMERKDVLFDGLVLPRYWILLLLIPSFGGLVCGFLVWGFAPEANGDGVDGVVRSFHFRNGFLRNRIPIVKTLSSFFTLGSGGSAGWEGPTMLLGAGVASSLAKPLRLSVKDRRVLLLAGAAGGLGAIFQIPFGGALFAIEVLYASTALEFSAIIPCLIASIVGYSTFRCIHGDIRILDLPAGIGIAQPTDFLIFLVFIPIVIFCGFCFIRLILEMRNRIFRRLNLPEFLKPALGGFLLGSVALLYPQVLGGGYEWMNRLLEGQLPFMLIAMLILPKMLATAFTVSSGGSGGVLVPSIFIGGLIGGVFGHLCDAVFIQWGLSAWSPNVTTCVLVGMSTFYAGIGKVPFAAAVIVCEMVGGDYSLLVPLIFLNLAHIAFQSPSLSLYEDQVLLPIDSEAHFGTYSPDLLQVITVREACRLDEKNRSEILTVPADATIPDTAKLIASKPDSLFPVVDEKGRLIGLLQASDLWSVFRSRKKWDMLSAQSIAQTMNISVFPEDDLLKSLRICTIWQVSELPIVDPQQPDKLLGMIRHHEIIAAYNERLAASQWS